MGLVCKGNKRLAEAFYISVWTNRLQDFPPAPTHCLPIRALPLFKCPTFYSGTPEKPLGSQIPEILL